MLALARFLIMGGVFLTVVYGCLWLYLRARRRALVELEYDTAQEDDRADDKDAWIDAQMAVFNARRTRLLFWGVYVLPLCIVALIVYLTNYH